MPPPQGGPAYQANYQAPQAAGLEENVACALCYLVGLLTGVLFLALAPYNQNKLIRFHAFQAIFSHIAMFIGWIVIGVLSFVPFAGVALVTVYWLGCVALWLLLMYKAYNREKWVLPVIGPLAEQQA